MNIHAIGPVAVWRASLSGQSAAEHPTPTQPSSVAPTASNGVQRASVTFSPPLSPEMNALLSSATQEIGPHGLNTDKMPPAQQARAAILASPELAHQPFGAVVSRIARGESLQFNTTPPVTTDEAVDAPPQEQSSVPPAIENPSPAVPDVIADATVNSLAAQPDSLELLNPDPILSDAGSLLGEEIPETPHAQ